MVTNARSARSWLRGFCAVATLVVLLAPTLPAAAAGKSADGARIEPALQRALAANPNGSFNVIVTRTAAADKTKRAAAKADVEDQVRKNGGKVRGSLDLIGGHLVTLNAKAIQTLAHNNSVKSISLNHKVKLQSLSGGLGGLLGQLGIGSTQTAAANVPQVWSTYGNLGQGVTVAVVDSGIAPNPDLASASFGVDTATGTTALGDLGGHGTHVAGIIAGNGIQSAGIYTGVAPAARVLEVKVTTDDGSASYASIIHGLQWVVAHAKAYNIRVANISLGATPTAGYADDPLDAAVEMAWFRGVAVVVSAGNSGPGPSTISTPGDDPYVITVGAADDNATAQIGDDVIPDWTSRGPTLVDGLAKPDVIASGRRVVSLRVVGSFLDKLFTDRVVSTNYFRLSGTSMAAPVVSGVAALLVSQNRNLTPNQIKYALKSSAHPLPGVAATAQGSGEVDALAAIRLVNQGISQSAANAGQTPSSGAATAIWPVLKAMSPVWRNKGQWMGRTWVDGSWDASGFKAQDGSWDDGSWDALAWSNLDWSSIAWEDGSWDNAAWDNLGWNDGSWDDGSWDDGSWDDGSWDTADTSPTAGALN